MLKRKDLLRSVVKPALILFSCTNLLVACEKKEVQTLEMPKLAATLDQSDEIATLRTFLSEKIHGDINKIIYDTAAAEFVIDGDVAMPLESAREHYAKSHPGGGGMTTFQTGYNNTDWVSPAIAPNVKVYVRPDMPADWQQAIDEGILAWNISNCLIKITRVYAADSIQAHITMRTYSLIGAPDLGGGTAPTSDGKPGNMIKFENTSRVTFGEKKVCVVHELGHNFGFFHTNADFSVKNPPILIDGTPKVDPLSIMNSPLPTQWTGFSVWDAVALGTKYPYKPLTVRLLRYKNFSHGDYFYTTKPDEIGQGQGVYTFEWDKQPGYVYPADFWRDGTTQLHRYFNARNGNHYYTTDLNELGEGNANDKYEGPIAYVYPYIPNQPQPDIPGLKPLYQYYNGTGLHWYTTNPKEIVAPFFLQKIACYVFDSNQYN